MPAVPPVPVVAKHTVYYVIMTNGFSDCSTPRATEGDFVHSYSEPDAEGFGEISLAFVDGLPKERMHLKQLLWIRDVYS